MVTINKPTKDSTIYEFNPRLNTGLDSIIELSYIENEGVSRILLQFPDSLYTEKLYDKYILKLYTSEVNEIQTNYSISAYPIYQTWNSGIGKFYNSPKTTEDVTWLSCKTNTNWNSGSYNNYSASLNYVYASGGSSFFSDFKVSESFNYSNTDINLDITSIVNAFNTGSVQNNGLLIKVEDESINFGDMKYFGVDTHTIYSPSILCYHTSFFESFYTGSIQQIDISKDIMIYCSNLQREYYQNEIIRMNIGCREKYVEKTYSQYSNYLIPHHLPSNTTYKIIDCISEDIIIDFDTIYTKISCDKNGNYIYIDLKNFDKNRLYKVVFQVNNNGINRIIDNDLMFKVI